MNQETAGLAIPRENDAERSEVQWRLLSQEVAHKQEWIERLLGEFEERVSTLRLATTEISELNSKKRILEAEASGLSRKLALESHIEATAAIESEASGLGEAELRAKLVSVAGAYRQERERNASFEAALRAAREEAGKVFERRAEFDRLTREQMARNREFLDLQAEAGRLSQLRSVLDKQNRVIARLEKGLELSLLKAGKTAKALERASQAEAQNLELKTRLREVVAGLAPGRGPAELREEVARLRNVRDRLAIAAAMRKPPEERGDDGARRAELEVELMRLKERVKALEAQLHRQSTQHSREINFQNY